MTDEVRAVFDTRAKSGGHLDTQVEGEPRISMNAFGPGIHTVEMVLKMTREKGLVEGMPNGESWGGDEETWDLTCSPRSDSTRDSTHESYAPFPDFDLGRQLQVHQGMF